MDFLYSYFLKPILFLFDPEFIHEAFIAIGRTLGGFGTGRWITSLFYNYKDKNISKTVDGIKYRTPVLLAAGFDYNANLTNILDCVSFGGEEVGSITNNPCEGNPKPRMLRLKKSKSIQVYKGLRNEGADRTITKLKSRKPHLVVGISIARTNSKDCATTEQGIEDYYNCFKKFIEADIGDYYTINISCPNAFGGEDFATPELLQILLTRLFSLEINKPVYIKMPINKSWEDFDKLLKVIDKFKVAGVIIGNLNKNYDDLDYREEASKEYRGGLSGKPCFELSNNLIKQTRAEWKDRFTIIGCGGIFTPEDAIIKFEAGADLVQLITGMIFEGPGLMKKICEQVSDLKS